MSDALRRILKNERVELKRLHHAVKEALEDVRAGTIVERLRAERRLERLGPALAEQLAVWRILMDRWGDACGNHD